MSASGHRGHAPHAATTAAPPVHGLLHHLTHAVELADQLVDVLHRRAGAGGDAAAAAGVEDLGVRALARGHGANDRLGLGHGVVRDVEVLDLPHARQHGQDLRQRAHLLDLLHLAEEVLERELSPIRERRIEFAKNMDYVYDMLKAGSLKAESVAAQTLDEVKSAMGINYFK